MEPAREPASVASCSNCGAILRGSWCCQCGQRASSQDPTWHDLVHDTIHEFLHFDGKIFITVRRLFFEPGSLTAEHIRGRRAQYIGTFQRMLFVLVPAFALLLKLGYRNGRHYPQFLYFALHFHAAVFGFLTLTVPLQALTYEGPEKIAQALVLAGSFAYLVAALKHVFGGTTLRTVLKAAALSAAYILVLAGASGVVILAIFYRLGAPAA